MKSSYHVSSNALLLTVVTCCFATESIANDKAWVAAKPLPEWIWAEGKIAGDQQIFLRKTFDIAGAVEVGNLYATCDNRMTLWINGKQVSSSDAWERPIVTDVKKFLKAGANVIAVDAQNAGGTAAFVLRLEIEASGKDMSVHTDTSWQMSKKKPEANWQSPEFDASSWNDKLLLRGQLGVGPWGIPKFRGNSGDVTDPADLQVADGFAVDLVYTVPKSQQGSWVAITNGPNGTLIACDQGGQGLFSIKVIETSKGPKAEVASMNVTQADGKGKLSGAQGLLWAFDSLWVHKNGGHLHRITDSNGDGTLDKTEQLPSQRGGGEHGNHALILSHDGKSILMDGGNHAPLHETRRSAVQSWDEDFLLSRMWDGNGHARGKLAPGGWVTRLDPETYEQELICIGFRNQYDIAMNQYGDVFTYDADMEWDLGMPWYRPTRICHVLSGVDYGWRSGTGKWPTYYEDTLPPVVEIGPGSPTGVCSGIGTRYPAKYQDAIFALDWTFGTIYAIHLRPNGAGYTGVSEAFVTGVPLPVTDATVGDDGHLYFAVGGRGAQSGLYRVRYNGSEVTSPVGKRELPVSVQQARSARQMLEQFHGRHDPEAVNVAWPHLSSNDRILRAAARVAIESQPVSSWVERACAEKDPQAKITSAVALARVGDSKHQVALLKSLLELDPESLNEAQQLGLLRAYALCFIRMGKPDEVTRHQVIECLNPHLPNPSADVSTELVRVLIYLESPGIVTKTMDLIKKRGEPDAPDWSELASRNAGYGGTVQKVLDNHPPSREINYALMLRNLRKGWTIQNRRDYFDFLNVAAKGSGGASFPKFMMNIRDEALANCSDAERIAVADITGEDFNPVPDFAIKPIEGPGREWTTDEANRLSARNLRQANFEEGRSLYFAASCGKCHRFNGLGGNVGPDLTSIRNKFDVNYVVEHIIDPNKIISDQYQSSIVLTLDGRTLTGLLAEEDGGVIVYPADVNAEPVKLSTDDIDEIRPSPQSQMPKGLIDGLNPEELRDLLAYLMSGGDPNAKKIYAK